MMLRTPTFLLALLALGACAHVPAESTVLPHPTNESTAMTAIIPAAGQSAAPIHPKLTAEQLLTRLLELIRSSKSLQDFTPQRLQEIMGVKIEYAKNGDDRYGFGETLTSEWSYGFGVDKSLPEGPRFELSFNDTAADDSSPMTDICQMDFERFKSELEAMGFTSAPYYAEHGRLMSYKFTSPGMWVEVYPRGERVWTAEKGSGRVCVQMVLI